MRRKLICVLLLLTLWSVLPSALGDVTSQIDYNAQTGAMHIQCQGLFPTNNYALAILEDASDGWTAGNLLFLDQVTASEGGALDVAFIHMGITAGVVMLGGETESVQSPLTLGTIVLPTDVLTLPAALTVIEEEAFMGNAYSYVYLGDKVSAIGARAFKNCASLQEIHIPSSVTSIGANAFDGCPNVVIVCASGSAAYTYARNNKLSYRLE